MWFLYLDWQFIVFSDSQQYKLNREWPKTNNEKVKFPRGLINQ